MNSKIWTVVLVLGLILPACRHRETVSAKVRPPARAGQFYPGSKEDLSGMVQYFLRHAPVNKVEGEILGIWVPHAGYAFSGQIAADAYRVVQGKPVDVVILFGPSHYVDFQGAATGDWDSVSTPLGSVAVDKPLVKALAASSSLISVVPGIDKEEHSIEVQVPFIQTVLPGVPIVPILIRDMPYGDSETLAKAVAGAVRGKRVLLVASSDMSHYPGYKDACKTDGMVLDAVRKYDPRQILKLDKELPASGIPGLVCTVCGPSALVTVMLTAKELGADKAQTLAYANSGDVSGEKDRVVGYGAAAFIDSHAKGINQGGGIMDSEEINFSTEEKSKLFRIARESIAAAITGERPQGFNVTEPNLLLQRGVFVTLTRHGRLRGCIGHFEQDTPLYEIVSQMSIAAATQDYRFLSDPVTQVEMKDIDVKISILSPLKKISSIEEIEVGKHGIWVRQNGRSGTFLPDVATDMGWNRIQFLEYCCTEKAGLPPDAWKKGADIYIYTSQILKEK
jgi:AmmeMemoRadiSam system protein B/AmmeMemoRadiSam system protein A